MQVSNCCFGGSNLGHKIADLGQEAAEYDIEDLAHLPGCRVLDCSLAADVVMEFMVLNRFTTIDS